MLWKPAIGLTYAFGTGDDDMTDNSYTRFDPLFQYNHACFGLSDMLKTSNANIIGLTASAKPNDSLQFGLGYFMSLAADKGDPMAGGVNWGLGGPADHSDVANEIDLWLDMGFTSRCKLQLGWAFVMPGGYVKDMVGDDDMAQRLYANLSLSF
jgi:hypothetical protein